MIEGLAAALREGRGLAHKRDIAPVMRRLGLSSAAIRVGDDCAAIPDGDGFLLFAIEGFLNEFVAAKPWFAGYCGVMVNVSDVAAMGGRPIAVVDAVWSDGIANAEAILDGLSTACATYGVPLVGGHTNTRADRGQLSVAILGRARRLLTSFDAAAGDVLIAAIDLRGRYHEPYPYWDASSGSDPARLRGDLNILPDIAEAQLCRTAKDISMGGVIGTALMLLEGSDLGGVINPLAVPRPAGVDLARWLATFPSFGFLLSVAPCSANAVLEKFAARGIDAAIIGVCDDSRAVRIAQDGVEAPIWDFAASPLIGCGHA